jgi:O-antigen/teichoic acid export membrane protein
LFGSLLTVRLASGAAAAVAFLTVTGLWLRELDQVALLAAAGAVFARSLSHYLFSFFLGLNRAARSGAGELISRWVLLVLITPGIALAGFRGACVALLVAELTVLAVGLWWSRPYLSGAWLRVEPAHVAPYLRFGLFFFAGNLLAMAFLSSGEAMVRAVSRDYAQVSYFALANGVCLTGWQAVQQLSMAFAAVLTTLQERGEHELLSEGIRRLVSWLAAGGTACVFAVLLVGGDLVPLVVGRSYGAVVANLIPMTLTLLVVSLSSAAGVVVLIHDRPGVALLASAIRLVAFWTLGPLLILRWESLGASLAVLAAATLHAMYLGWRMRAVMSRALRAWTATVGLGALFLPLVLLRSSWMVDAALYTGFLLGYFGMLLLARILTVREIVATWRAVGLAGRAQAGKAGRT